MSDLTQFPELKYCVTFFQIVKPNNSALSPKFAGYEQALDAFGRVLDMTAKISEQTVYFSEANEIGRLELLIEIVTPEDELDIVCYQVIDSANSPLSPLYEAREQADAYLSEINSNAPAAKITKYAFEFSSIDEERRIDLLNRIIKANSAEPL